MNEIPAIYRNHMPCLVAIDCVIFGYHEGDLKLLAIKRNMEPAFGQWSLMGGFLEENEDLDQAAARILKQLTGLTNVYLEQLHTYGNPNRDPGARVVSVAYYAIINLSGHNKELAKEFDARWFNINDKQELIFDHAHMVEMALEELQKHARIVPVGITLLPDKFTIPQLQELYEAILQKKLDRGNFRKSILSLELLKKLEEKDKSSSRKGAWFYRFDEKRFNELIKNGVLIKI
jgi:8-oxo-dGTP diphosphatase